jgi:O-antigen/teichoic acid export membrane protein
MRFLAEAAARGNSFVVTPLLAWVLGAAVFGSYAQIQSLSFAFVPLVSAGLGFTVIRQVAAHKEPVNSTGLLFFCIGLLSALCLVLGVFLSAISAEVLKLLSLSWEPEPTLLVCLVTGLAWATALDALTQEYFRAQKWVRYSLAIQLIAIFLHLALLFAVFFAGELSIWSAVLTLVFAKLLVVIFVLVNEVRRGRQEVSGKQLARPQLTVLVSGIPFMLAGLAEWAGNLGSRLIVGQSMGAEMVAQYTAAVMLLSAIVALGAPFWWLLFPEIVRYKSSGNIELCNAVIQHRTMSFLELSVPVFALICLTADPAVSLLVNSSTSEISSVVFVLGVAVLINQVATGWEYFVVSVSSGKRLLLATSGSALIGFVLAVILAQDFGMLGVAFGILLGKLFLAITYLSIARYKGMSGLVFKPKRSGAIVLISLVAYLSVEWMLDILHPDGTVTKITLAAILFASLYGVGNLTMLRVARLK